MKKSFPLNKTEGKDFLYVPHHHPPPKCVSSKQVWLTLWGKRVTKTELLIPRGFFLFIYFLSLAARWRETMSRRGSATVITKRASARGGPYARRSKQLSFVSTYLCALGRQESPWCQKWLYVFFFFLLPPPFLPPPFHSPSSLRSVE